MRFAGHLFRENVHRGAAQLDGALLLARLFLQHQECVRIVPRHVPRRARVGGGRLGRAFE